MANFSEFRRHIGRAITTLEKIIEKQKMFGLPDAIINDSSDTLRKLKEIYESYAPLSEEERKKLKELERKYEERQNEFDKKVYS